MIEGVDVRAQPRFHLLVARGLGPGVGTGAERGDEEGSLPGYAGDAVVNRNRRSGPIDEGFLAGLVLLPHHYVRASCASADTVRRNGCHVLQHMTAVMWRPYSCCAIM